MPSIIIHIHNEDPVLCEVEDLPTPTDQIITVRNPRKRDGKDLTYIDARVTTVIWPISRINFIEVLPGEEEEQIISFVRE
ncbi:hypothetical protein ADN00_13715 [Ornatilinea apprima]|uniref:Uncharacterized protein n=1 Tax=Ornatilinea apprima TaxID=1134406 RepID=A0A0P6XZ10_9CHLR|nr:hypothetical protein [Ornatilinea apprima]KPL74352.1 hypothetical protein ADN00_13715 [Ornatilinea apprima]